MSNASVIGSLSWFIRWRIVVLLMGYAAMAHFNRVSMSVAGSEIFIKQYQFTPTQMGWVYTAFLVVYTIGMIPGGWCIDRLGAARTLMLLGLFMGAFVALTGATGWVLTSPASLWLGLIIIRSCAGLSDAPLHPGAAHVVSDVITPKGRSTANAMVTTGALLGIAFSYPVFGWLIDQVGWSWAFVITGLALVTYSQLWKYLAVNSLARSPSFMTSVSETRPDHGGWQLLGQRNLWLLTLSYAAYSYFQYLFFYWMSFYFESILHVSEIEARRASFIIIMAQAAGMLIGGMFSDVAGQFIGIMKGRRAVMMTGMGLAGLFGLVGVSVTDYFSVVLFLSIAMGLQGMCESVFWTMATDIAGKRRGFCGAFMNAGGNVGGLISPVLTPFLAESIGWSNAIVVACGVSALGGVIWFLIKAPDSETTT